MQRLALIHQIAGDQAESSAILQLLSQLDLDQMGRETDETGALRARIRLMRGDLENAARWADGFTAPVPNQPWPWQDPPHLIKARILLARGAAADMQSALEILDAFYEEAERGHNKRLKIEVLALRALALDAAGKAGEAMDTLRAAVDLAQRGGFLRPFLDLGPRMKEALSELARQDDMRGNAMLRRILAEFNGQSIDAAQAEQEVKHLDQAVMSKPAAWLNSDKQSPIEPLSPRELEVLSLLRDPISLKDVAQRLFISYQTAKRHTANIYGKLGVNKRRAAIAKAEDLGLLPPR